MWYILPGENVEYAGKTNIVLRQERIKMVKKELVIRNHAGIHCRPSSVVIAKAGEFPGHEFKLVSSRGTAQLTGILDLLALGLQCGEKITLEVSGEKESEALTVVGDALEFEYDFK